MYSILDIISGTPWWVWFLFVYLIIVGIKALHPTIASWQRFIVMPLIFLLWSLYSLYNKYGISVYVFGFWFILLILGIFVGWRITRHGINVDKKTRLIHLRGSWYPLIFSMLFFAVKYATGVILATSPEMRSYAPLWITDATASGLITGISWSRFLHIMQKFQQI